MGYAAQLPLIPVYNKISALAGPSALGLPSPGHNDLAALYTKHTVELMAQRAGIDRVRLSHAEVAQR